MNNFARGRLAAFNGYPCPPDASDHFALGYAEERRQPAVEIELHDPTRPGA